MTRTFLKPAGVTAIGLAEDYAGQQIELTQDSD